METVYGFCGKHELRYPTLPGSCPRCEAERQTQAMKSDKHEPVTLADLEAQALDEPDSSYRVILVRHHRLRESYERLVAAARKAKHFMRTHGGYKFVRAEYPFEVKLMDDEDFVPVLDALDAALPAPPEGGAS